MLSAPFPFGPLLLPNQPCFAAYGASTVSNATGDGTVASLVFGTEDYDLHSDFASSTFTAPIAGRYRFSLGVALSGLLSGHTQSLLEIVANSKVFQVERMNPYTKVDGGGFVTTGGVIDVSMAAGTTAIARVTVTGSTKVVGIYGDAGSTRLTRFSGSLIA